MIALPILRSLSKSNLALFFILNHCEKEQILSFAMGDVGEELKNFKIIKEGDAEILMTANTNNVLFNKAHARVFWVFWGHETYRWRRWFKLKKEEMSEEFKGRMEEMDDLEALNQYLVVKEGKSNDELQEAQKEMIKGLTKMVRSWRSLASSI